jgi:L-alanine-DL-glutamate epimerase-like enolase superfamily enzyme
MMKLTNIEVIPFSIPYKRIVSFGNVKQTHAEHVLVRVRTDGGLVGQAEAPARPFVYGESQTSIVTAIRNWFTPAIQGLDALRVEAIYERMTGIAGNHAARGAIDLAVWDIIGKALGQPCRILLGGYTTSLRASELLNYGEPAQMVAHAVQMQQRYGISAFKIKTGRAVKLDVAACTAIRKSLPDAELYIDANHGWTADEAIQFARQTAELGLSFYEEPSPAEDRIGRRRFNQTAGIPVGGDESCTRLSDAARELTDGIAHMISIKTARTGFTESRRILGLCEGLSAPVVMGSQGDSMVGTLGTLNFGAAFRLSSIRPAEVTNFLELADDLLTNPLVIADGRLIATDAPGLGLEIDEGKLNRYRIDR